MTLKTFKRGNDITESLWTLTNVDKPKLESSTDKDEEKQKQEKWQHEIIFKAGLDKLMRRKGTYKDYFY